MAFEQNHAIQRSRDVRDTPQDRQHRAKEQCFTGPLQGNFQVVGDPALKRRAKSLSPFGARFCFNVRFAESRYARDGPQA